MWRYKMQIKRETVEKIEALRGSIINDQGKEVNDPTPLFIAGESKPLSLQEQIQRVLRVEVSKQAQDQGYESIEEAEDFDVEDSFDVKEPITKYEMMEDEYLMESNTTPPAGSVPDRGNDKVKKEAEPDSKNPVEPEDENSTHT